MSHMIEHELEWQWPSVVAMTLQVIIILNEPTVGLKAVIRDDYGNTHYNLSDK